MNYRPYKRTNYAVSHLYHNIIADLARYGVSRAKDLGIWGLWFKGGMCLLFANPIIFPPERIDFLSL